ncbi:hypothetical protein BaRGS_00004597 [Batillaria attramentaria]|uniref:Uncharacterized protein n=1 Tax=Batillaria attramentaria TaxID=370345 RepID=A0ABD0LXW4_9CAEN
MVTADDVGSGACGADLLCSLQCWGSDCAIHNSRDATLSLSCVVTIMFQARVCFLADRMAKTEQQEIQAIDCNYVVTHTQ